MAKLKKPPIPLKMYKHFAVATLALTAGIAMFADDGKREAVVDKFEERQRQNELLAANAEKFGAPRLIRREHESAGGTFGSEAGDMGSPSLVTGGGGGGVSPAAPQQARGRAALAGYDQASVDAMSEAEYSALRQTASEEDDALSAEERARARREMMARQRRQAGGRGSSDYIE